MNWKGVIGISVLLGIILLSILFFASSIEAATKIGITNIGEAGTVGNRWFKTAVSNSDSLTLWACWISNDKSLLWVKKSIDGGATWTACKPDSFNIWSPTWGDRHTGWVQDENDSLYIQHPVYSGGQYRHYVRRFGAPADTASLLRTSINLTGVGSAGDHHYGVFMQQGDTDTFWVFTHTDATADNVKYHRSRDKCGSFYSASSDSGWVRNLSGNQVHVACCYYNQKPTCIIDDRTDDKAWYYYWDGDSWETNADSEIVSYAQQLIDPTCVVIQDTILLYTFQRESDKIRMIARWNTVNGSSWNEDTIDSHYSIIAGTQSFHQSMFAWKDTAVIVYSRKTGDADNTREIVYKKWTTTSLSSRVTLSDTATNKFAGSVYRLNENIVKSAPLIWCKSDSVFFAKISLGDVEKPQKRLGKSTLGGINLQ